MPGHKLAGAEPLRFTNQGHFTHCHARHPGEECCNGGNALGAPPDPMNQHRVERLVVGVVVSSSHKNLERASAMGMRDAASAPSITHGRRWEEGVAVPIPHRQRTRRREQRLMLLHQPPYPPTSYRSMVATSRSPLVLLQRAALSMC